jgi:hypothetical protein
MYCESTFVGVHTVLQDKLPATAHVTTPPHHTTFTTARRSITYQGLGDITQPLIPLLILSCYAMNSMSLSTLTIDTKLDDNITNEVLYVRV